MKTRAQNGNQVLWMLALEKRRNIIKIKRRNVLEKTRAAETPMKPKKAADSGQLTAKTGSMLVL